MKFTSEIPMKILFKQYFFTDSNNGRVPYAVISLNLIVNIFKQPVKNSFLMIPTLAIIGVVVLDYVYTLLVGFGLFNFRAGDSVSKKFVRC